MEAKKLLRPKDAAQHFSISTNTLWRWTKLPDFPQPFKRVRTVLYDVAAIEKWLAGGRANKCT